MAGAGAGASAELALETLADARALLNPDTWDTPPTSLQPFRTIWSASRKPANGGDLSLQGDEKEVPTVRCTGRVRGGSPRLLAELLMDERFHAFRHEQRFLQEVIVPNQLWVLGELVLWDVPNIQEREFCCVSTHAEQADGAILVIERSIEHEAWPRRPSSVRGWRCLAILLSMVTPSSTQSSSALSESAQGGDQHNDALRVLTDGEPACEGDVDVAVVLQVDLGNIAEHFTGEYALEQVDLMTAIDKYTSTPGWPAERKRLMSEGPRLPARPAQPHRRAGLRKNPAASSRSAGGTRDDDDDGSGRRYSYECKSVSEASPTEDMNKDLGDINAQPMVALSADSALHRAQVMAFAQLRVNPNAQGGT